MTKSKDGEPSFPSIEELEEAFRLHEKSTCRVDCCIICFSESMKEERELHEKGKCKPFCLVCNEK